MFMVTLYEDSMSASASTYVFATREEADGFIAHIRAHHDLEFLSGGTGELFAHELEPASLEATLEVFCGEDHEDDKRASRRGGSHAHLTILLPARSTEA